MATCVLVGSAVSSAAKFSCAFPKMSDWTPGGILSPFSFFTSFSLEMVLRRLKGFSISLTAERMSTMDFLSSVTVFCKSSDRWSTSALSWLNSLAVGAGSGFSVGGGVGASCVSSGFLLLFFLSDNVKRSPCRYICIYHTNPEIIFNMCEIAIYISTICNLDSNSVEIIDFNLESEHALDSFKTLEKQSAVSPE